MDSKANLFKTPFDPASYSIQPTFLPTTFSWADIKINDIDLFKLLDFAHDRHMMTASAIGAIPVSLRPNHTFRAAEVNCYPRLYTKWHQAAAGFIPAEPRLAANTNSNKALRHRGTWSRGAMTGGAFYAISVCLFLHKPINRSLICSQNGELNIFREIILLPGPDFSIKLLSCLNQLFYLMVGDHPGHIIVTGIAFGSTAIQIIPDFLIV